MHLGVHAIQQCRYHGPVLRVQWRDEAVRALDDQLDPVHVQVIVPA
jgi:hypothetical protein